jgi:hypothetical protein
MRKAYYLPYTDNAKVAWFMNFSSAFATIAETFDFTKEEVESVKNDFIVCKYMNETCSLFKSELQERTRYKDLLFMGEIGTSLGSFPSLPEMPVAPSPVAAGVFKRTGKLVQRIKSHPKYNVSIGRNLGIIGAEKVIDLDAIKPEIKIKAVTADSISISFIKNRMDGVVVYAGTPMRMPAVAGNILIPDTETEVKMNWVEIAKNNLSPFIDKRPNSSTKPETRYYKMRYFRKDVLVGEDSDIIYVVSIINKV